MKALFSADEFKWSMIASCMFAFTIAAIWGYHQFHTIDSTLAGIINTAFYSVTGMNVFKTATTGVTNYLGSNANAVDQTAAAPLSSESGIPL